MSTIAETARITCERGCILDTRDGQGRVTCKGIGASHSGRIIVDGEKIFPGEVAPNRVIGVPANCPVVVRNGMK
jgi:hypothetical protein